MRCRLRRCRRSRRLRPEKKKKKKDCVCLGGGHLWLGIDRSGGARGGWVTYPVGLFVDWGVVGGPYHFGRKKKKKKKTAYDSGAGMFV